MLLARTAVRRTTAAPICGQAVIFSRWHSAAIAATGGGEGCGVPTMGSSPLPPPPPMLATSSSSAAAIAHLDACMPPRAVTRTGWLRGTPTLLAPPNRKRKSLPRYRHENQLNPLAKETVIDPRVLYLVSVPIGNVKDFTLRALDVLRKVDYVLCADTGFSRYLFDNIDVETAGRLIQYDRNGTRNGRMLELLRGGSSIAFVVPQGTPCVGDFGGSLVRDALQSGVRVSAVPGVDAATAALSMSGASTLAEGGAYKVNGHLSTRRTQRLGDLQSAAAATHPTVFFEAAPRLLKTLTDIAVVAPGRRVAVLHEITRLHEATHADTVERLIRYYQRGSMNPTLRKGQLCVVMDGRLPSKPTKEGATLPRAGDAREAAGTPSGSVLGARLSSLSSYPPTADGMGLDTTGEGASPARVDPQSAGPPIAALTDRAAVERDFLHFAVVRHMVRTAAPLTEAIAAVALAVGAAPTQVREAFDAQERLEEAEGAKEVDVASHYTRRARRDNEEEEEGHVDGNHQYHSTATPSQDQRQQPAPSAPPRVVPVHSRAAAVASADEEGQRRHRDLDAAAAAEFLSVRAALRRGNPEVDGRTSPSPSAAATSPLGAHVPDDWAPEVEEGGTMTAAAPTTTAAAAAMVAGVVIEKDDVLDARANRYAERAVSRPDEHDVLAPDDDDEEEEARLSSLAGHSSAAVDGSTRAPSGSKPTTDNVTEDTTATKKQKQKKKKKTSKKGGLAERLRLQRLVDEQREHLRLVQMGLAAGRPDRE